MSEPMNRGPRLAVAVQVVFCPVCKTQMQVKPNMLHVVCPNPTCHQRIEVHNPIFQRGGR